MDLSNASRRYDLRLSLAGSPLPVNGQRVIDMARKVSEREGNEALKSPPVFGFEQRGMFTAREQRAMPEDMVLNTLSHSQSPDMGRMPPSILAMVVPMTGIVDRRPLSADRRNYRRSDGAVRLEIGAVRLEIGAGLDQADIPRASPPMTKLRKKGMMM
jgi:hypothetical protein